MFEDSKVAFFLAKRSIVRGNKGTLYLTILIIGMVFVNLIFLPSIISGVAVLFNQQSIDYSYGNLVIEPKKNQVYINNVNELQKKIERVPGVTGVSPRYITGASVFHKGNAVNPIIYAINPDDDRKVLKISSKVTNGEYLSNADTDQIVIGSRLAGNDDEKLDVIPSLGGVKVGQAVDITFNNGVSRQYRIKGIINSDSFSADANVFMTTKEYESVFGLEDKASQILVRTQETGNEEDMRNTLYSFGVQEKIWTWEEKSANFLNQIIGSFNIINLIGTDREPDYCSGSHFYCGFYQHGLPAEADWHPESDWHRPIDHYKIIYLPGPVHFCNRDNSRVFLPVLDTPVACC